MISCLQTDADQRQVQYTSDCRTSSNLRQDRDYEVLKINNAQLAS